MKSIKLLPTLLFLLFIVGCARNLVGTSPTLFNNLAVGMSTEETVAILGDPLSKSVSHGATLLHYKCVEKGSLGTDGLIDYAVLLRNNEVLAFGRHTSFANDPVRWGRPKKSKNIDDYR
jgi:hypothetical protein